MKKYQKPEITVLSFLSKEAISQSLEDWLAGQSAISADSELQNSIETYDVSSVMI